MRWRGAWQWRKAATWRSSRRLRCCTTPKAAIPQTTPPGALTSTPQRNSPARCCSKKGWQEQRIEAVLHCIRAHRFRDEREQPQTLEAQVLFDADKLDAIGAIGVSRAIAFSLQAGQPVYSPPSERFRQTGALEPGEAHSAYHEYLFKLSKLKDRLYTPAARRIAEGRHQAMAQFFAELAEELDGRA